jgi:transposase
MKDKMKESIEKRFGLIEPYLNEKAKRVWVALEAEEYGYGGNSAVASATGLSRNTIRKGMEDLKQCKTGEAKSKIRQPGGGRKKAVVKYPEIEKVLFEILEPEIRGEPDSSLLWTCKSLRNLSSELKSKGYTVSHRVVGEILKSNGFSLQGNRKTYEGKGHPDRNEQFNFIHNKVKVFQQNNDPIISVDTKKKELIGNYKNNGQEWHSKGNPEKVNVYDFSSQAEGKAIPYGVYDVSENKGWVNVGVNHDTAMFAVNSIRMWWYEMGQTTYPNASNLFITADGGGSNGSKVRLWKTELQKLANELKINISVSHFPPGTSKWNKIEHRLFSYISKNWRGKPLISFEVVIKLIAATKTDAGLIVKSNLDKREYPKGIKISKKELSEVNIIREIFHGEWNYTIRCC